MISDYVDFILIHGRSVIGYLMNLLLLYYCFENLGIAIFEGWVQWIILPHCFEYMKLCLHLIVLWDFLTWIKANFWKNLGISNMLNISGGCWLLMILWIILSPVWIMSCLGLDLAVRTIIISVFAWVFCIFPCSPSWRWWLPCPLFVLAAPSRVAVRT